MRCVTSILWAGLIEEKFAESVSSNCACTPIELSGFAHKKKMLEMFISQDRMKWCLRVVWLDVRRKQTCFPWQLLEAETARAIFQDNIQLCNEVTERVVQHFVHCIETHGRHVQYLRFLQTIVKSEGNFIRKCQDTVMAEVRLLLYSFVWGVSSVTGRENSLLHASNYTLCVESVLWYISCREHSLFILGGAGRA